MRWSEKTNQMKSSYLFMKNERNYICGIKCMRNMYANDKKLYMYIYWVHVMIRILYLCKLAKNIKWLYPVMITTSNRKTEKFKRKIKMNKKHMKIKQTQHTCLCKISPRWNSNLPFICWLYIIERTTTKVLYLYKY